MRYFRQHYDIPSTRLSMERAMECDRVDDIRASLAKKKPRAVAGAAVEERRQRFDMNAYRQPVLTQPAAMPLPYRRGQDDAVTANVTADLIRYQSRLVDMTLTDIQEMLTENSMSMSVTMTKSDII